MAPRVRTALIQALSQTPDQIPLILSSLEAIPSLPSPHHVLICVHAVALNPNDHKILTHFPLPGNGAGCDFSGVVVRPPGSTTDEGRDIKYGTRVCGTVFAYAKTDENNQYRRIGAFSEFVIADSRLLIQLPSHWSDLQGAALGGVGWSTAALAISHPEYLGLPGIPSRPAQTSLPVLVYGGGTATGTMACQLLKLSGYLPIAVTQSSISARLAMQNGAVGAVDMLTRSEVEVTDAISRLAGGKPIRHALDCITDGGSAAVCFSAIARTGGRYVCLEQFRSEWRTRRAVSVKEVMGYEILGHHVDLGGVASPYTRVANEEAFRLGVKWAAEMQNLILQDLVHAHPSREVPGKWEGILSGLAILQSGKAGGQKLVVRVSD